MKLSKVLIVEDEPEIALIANIALSDLAGIETKLAGNGKEALEVLDSWSPDLVLMDIMMPEMTGEETLAFIKQDNKLKNINVIIMTAKSEDEQVQRFKSMGALEVIIKPFDPMTLVKDLEKILNGNN